MVIDLRIACVPPNVTAQQKRVSFQSGKPVFFHDERMGRETHTWAVLLRPHVPKLPVAGPVRVIIVGIYPHKGRTPKRDQALVLPKMSKPDASNYAKHLEDLLVKMRFLEADHFVGSLTVEKWHGPADQVGIRIRIEPLLASSSPALGTESAA